MTSLPRLQTVLPTYESEACYADEAAEPGDGVMYDVDAKRWGGAYWCMIHMAAYAYPDEPSTETRQAMYQQFDAMRYTIPCSACRGHYRQFWIEHPIDEALSSRDALIEWTTLLHERVNENVGAPPFDLAPYLARLLGEDVVVDDVKDNDEPPAAATAPKHDDAQPTNASTTKAAPAKKGKKEPAATPIAETKRNASRRPHSRRTSTSDHKTASRHHGHGRESMRAAMYIAQSKALESVQRTRLVRQDGERNSVHTFTWKHYITQSQRQTPGSSAAAGRHVRPPKECPDCQKEIKASQF